MFNQNQKIHIGNIISEKLKEEGRTKKWLASQAHCEHSSMCKMLKRTHIDTEILEKISLSVKYNFFKILSEKTDNDLQNHKNG